MIPGFYPILEAQGLLSTNRDGLDEDPIILSAARIAFEPNRVSADSRRSARFRIVRAACRATREHLKEWFSSIQRVIADPVICLRIPVLAGRW